MFQVFDSQVDGFGETGNEAPSLGFDAEQAKIREGEIRGRATIAIAPAVKARNEDMAYSIAVVLMFGKAALPP